MGDASRLLGRHDEFGAAAVSLSVTALVEMAKRESGDPPLILLTISHPDLPEPIRLAHNPGTDVTSSISGGSETYTGTWVDVTMMGNEPGEISRAAIRIDDTLRVIRAALADLTSLPTADIDVVMESEPNTAIASHRSLRIGSTTTDAINVEAQLDGPAFLSEVVPGLTMTREVAPGLYE